MNLLPEEPFYGPWTVETLADFTSAPLNNSAPSNKPKIIAIDGRSAGGKTSLAARLQQAIHDSVVVHIDDIPSCATWRGSEAQATILTDPLPEGCTYFDWLDNLVDNVLEPLKASQAVNYRPASWNDWNRPAGAIEIPTTCPVVIVEGVGSTRRELSSYLDASIWIQSDFDLARTRGIERDGDGVEGWEKFEADEIPFFAEQTPWERADFVLCSTPDIELSEEEILVSSQTPLTPKNP